MCLPLALRGCRRALYRERGLVSVCQVQGYLCTPSCSGVIQPIFPGLSWLVMGCESYCSVALSQVQYL